MNSLKYFESIFKENSENLLVDVEMLFSIKNSSDFLIKNKPHYTLLLREFGQQNN